MIVFTQNGVLMSSYDASLYAPGVSILYSSDDPGPFISTIGGAIYEPKEVYRRCEHCQQLNDDHPGGCTYCGAPLPKS